MTLMTLHNAKGLEYPIVFIAGCEDGVFPHSRALDEGGLEEERRLFYVGVTRAMRELYLTYARRRAVFGAQTYGLPSRFLDEIPAELTDREQEQLCCERRRCRWAALATGARSDRTLVGDGGWASAARWAPAAGVTAGPARALAAWPPARDGGSAGRSGSARTSCTPPSATASSPAWSPAG